MITFTRAQYIYRAFMYDTFQMAGDSVEYPDKNKSYNEMVKLRSYEFPSCCLG